MKYGAKIILCMFAFCAECGFSQNAENGNWLVQLGSSLNNSSDTMKGFTVGWAVQSRAAYKSSSFILLPEVSLVTEHGTLRYPSFSFPGDTQFNHTQFAYKPIACLPFAERAALCATLYPTADLFSTKHSYRSLSFFGAEGGIQYQFANSYIISSRYVYQETNTKRGNEKENMKISRIFIGLGRGISK